MILSKNYYNKATKNKNSALIYISKKGLLLFLSKLQLP